MSAGLLCAGRLSPQAGGHARLLPNREGGQPVRRGHSSTSSLTGLKVVIIFTFVARISHSLLRHWSRNQPSALTGKISVEAILHNIIGNSSHVLEATSPTLAPPESPSQNTDGGAPGEALVGRMGRGPRSSPENKCGAVWLLRLEAAL